MDSNIDLTVDDNEVPQKTDHQSDNGLEISREESSNNSEVESMDPQKCGSDESVENEVKDSDGNNGSKDDKSGPNASRHQYSKEQLIQISKQSLARIRPKCLDHTFNNPHNGLWNPEKWISSRSPVANTSGNKFNNKRVNSDLKERVVEEESDIILSPQRGSFGTGCHVSANNFATNRSVTESRSRDHYSERNKMDESNDGSHRSNINTRRVGSGRIVPKERERNNEWIDRSYERGYDRDGRDGRDSRDNRDNRNDDFNDRRGGRFERRSNREMTSNRNNRFESQRYHKYREEEDNEPEWFTEGPTSKHDTIELKGFDDEPDYHQKDKEIEDKSKKLKDNNESNVENPMNAKDIKGTENESKSEDFDVNAMFKFENIYSKSEASDEIGISDNANNKTDIKSKSRFIGFFNESQSESSNPSSMTRLPNTQTSKQLTPEKKILNLFSNDSNHSSAEQMIPQKLELMKAKSLAEIEANFLQMDLNNSADKGSDNIRNPEKNFNSSKISAQNLNYVERGQNRNELRDEATILSTQNTNVVIPKSITNGMSLLQMLNMKENEEKKEAMTDPRTNNTRFSDNRMNGTNLSNIMAVQQNSANNQMYGMQPMVRQNWQNNSPVAKSAQPVYRIPSNQEMSDHTSFLLRSRQMESPLRQNEAIQRTPPNNRSVSNAFTPTSVMRNMYSEKDRDSFKSVQNFNEMSVESNSSQQKFPNEALNPKPSAMRPIVKSNNPIAQSMAAKQSPVSSQSHSMLFGANSESIMSSSTRMHPNLQQQIHQQNQSPINSYQPNVPTGRSFGSSHSLLSHTSIHSPNAMNSLQMDNKQFMQMMTNASNVRPNVNSMHQMMSLQNNSVSDGRQSQYSQSRAFTAPNVQQMLSNHSNLEAFNSCDRNMMSESEAFGSSVPTTYSQPRPQMQQIFPNLVHSQPNRNRNIGNEFLGLLGQDSLRQSLSDLPAVPHQNALTLDDIERS